MSGDIDNRKMEHVTIIRDDPTTDRCQRYFDAIHLTHRALPEIDLDAVDPSIDFLGRRLSFPLLISSMTGGQDDQLKTVNRNLAMAAEATGVAMGVGSQRVMFTSPNARESFALRSFAPTTVLLANLGAVQLNCGFDVGHCRDAISVVDADGLCLHLNPLQEAVQPEGDTNFGGLAARIGEIGNQLSQPVIVKEVGAGLSRADVERLLAVGVRYVDVAGSGGTSWSRIEQHRCRDSERRPLGFLFQDWGVPTPVALRDLQPLRNELTVLASGGIRTGIDMVKATILGASLCGMAAPFLEPALKSADDVIIVINALRREFITAMFLLGAASVADLQYNNALIINESSLNLLS